MYVNIKLSNIKDKYKYIYIYIYIIYIYKYKYVYTYIYIYIIYIYIYINSCGAGERAASSPIGAWDHNAIQMQENNV